MRVETSVILLIVIMLSVGEGDEFLRAIVQKEYGEARKCLAENKFDWSYRDQYDNTLLHLAAAKAPAGIVKLLLMKGGMEFVHAFNSHNRVPLNLALTHRNSDMGVIVALADAAGLITPPAIDKEGNTCIHVAVIVDSPALSYLLSAGGKNYFSCRNWEGMTPLALAAKHRKFSVYKILREDFKAREDEVDPELLSTFHQLWRMEGFHDIMEKYGFYY